MEIRQITWIITFAIEQSTVDLAESVLISFFFTLQRKWEQGLQPNFHNVDVEQIQYSYSFISREGNSLVLD